MGVLPNFTAVDSNTRLPRLATREKFVIAMHDSVDYSSFLIVAALAGKGLYSNSIPSLGTGPAGFGRYYWREFTDRSPAPSSPRLFSPLSPTRIPLLHPRQERLL
jgi:hypothetical protein